jgi:hypothetical protein
VNGHLVEALVTRGWDVMRAIDVYPERTPDPVVFERAALENRAFVSNDEGILKVAAQWLEESRSFRMIFWPQEDYRAWTIGELVRAFEELAHQDDPFRYPIYRLRPQR